jgi:hypothetical protein
MFNDAMRLQWNDDISLLNVGLPILTLTVLIRKSFTVVDMKKPVLQNKKRSVRVEKNIKY